MTTGCNFQLISLNRESQRGGSCAFFFCRGSSSAEYAAHKALLGVADEICAYLHAYQCIHVCAYVAMVKKKKKGLKQERLDLPLSTCFKAPSSPYYSAVLRGSV